MLTFVSLVFLVLLIYCSHVHCSILELCKKNKNVLFIQNRNSGGSSSGTGRPDDSVAKLRDDLTTLTKRVAHSKQIQHCRNFHLYNVPKSDLEFKDIVRQILKDGLSLGEEEVTQLLDDINRIHRGEGGKAIVMGFKSFSSVVKIRENRKNLCDYLNPFWPEQDSPDKHPISFADDLTPEQNTLKRKAVDMKKALKEKKGDTFRVAVYDHLHLMIEGKKVKVSEINLSDY